VGTKVQRAQRTTTQKFGRLEN